MRVVVRENLIDRHLFTWSKIQCTANNFLSFPMYYISLGKQNLLFRAMAMRHKVLNLVLNSFKILIEIHLTFDPYLLCIPRAVISHKVAFVLKSRKVSAG